MKKNRAKELVLLVEDDYALRNIIRLNLEKKGYVVNEADNVDDALKKTATSQNIKYIWLDHHLNSTKTGLDFVKELKKFKKFNSLPIFVVSCSTSRNNVLEYIDLGVHEHIGKIDHPLKDIVQMIEEKLN